MHSPTKRKRLNRWNTICQNVKVEEIIKEKIKSKSHQEQNGNLYLSSRFKSKKPYLVEVIRVPLSVDAKKICLHWFQPVCLVSETSFNFRSLDFNLRTNACFYLVHYFTDSFLSSRHTKGNLVVSLKLRARLFITEVSEPQRCC